MNVYLRYTSTVSHKRALRVILIKMLIFLSFFFFWMDTILRLIYEILRWIALKISFIWGCKLRVYAAAPFAASVKLWYSRKKMQNFTSVNLYLNVMLNAYLELILHHSDVFEGHQKLFKPEIDFKQTLVINFLFIMRIWRNFSITSRLH